MNYKLSPSALTFGYEGCKRCFYLKVVHGISQPSIPLPSIFTQIANLLKNHYDGKHTSSLHTALPPEQSSQVRSVSNHQSSSYPTMRTPVTSVGDLISSLALMMGVTVLWTSEPVTQGTMWTYLIIFPPPLLNQYPGLNQSCEYLPVKQFIP